MNDEPDISRRGIMLVLSSPSGAGKTTLTRNLLEQENIEHPGKLALSVSATTRPKRPSEIDGVNADSPLLRAAGHQEIGRLSREGDVSY